MAQIIRYFENNVEYTEGPFVLTKLNSYDDYRLEVELKDHHCPVLTGLSIDRLIVKRKQKFCVQSDRSDGRPLARLRGTLDKMTFVCDWLNQQVNKGVVILKHGAWVFES